MDGFKALVCMTFLAVTAPALAEAAEAPGNKLVQEGIAVELAVEPLLIPGQPGQPPREGESARIRLTVTDTNTGAPLSGLYPTAWLDRRQPDLTSGGASEGAAGCHKKVESFLGGGLLSRPEIDLNTYYVLALNDDASLSVVDPLFGYGSSKLLTMVFLKSRGVDWVLTADARRLFVAMPDADAVAVVDTETWKVTADLPAGRHPRRLGLQPDGQLLWTVSDSGVTVIDVRDARVVKELPAPGLHDLTFSSDSRWALAASEKEGTVTVFDAVHLTRLRDVAVGGPPVSLDWSAAASAAYVSVGNGTIVAVRPDAAEPVAKIVLKTPKTDKQEKGMDMGRLRFAPGGRLGFVLQPARKLVRIFDATSNRLVQTADVEAEPDQVTFSKELAYVRHRGSEQVLMIPLQGLGAEGRPVPLIDFPGGEHPPGRSTGGVAADGIVATPGEAAVLVANPEDETIYFYKEGMAAPMGHFQNYGRQPRAVLVVDRTLREVRPGVYETETRMTGAGDYELALLLDSPRIVHCFPVKVAENPVLAAERSHKPLGIEVLSQTDTVTAGQEATVRFRLTDPNDLKHPGAPKTGLHDVRVLTFLSPGVWQQRHWATESAAGIYEIRFQPPEAGLYFIFLEVASAGMPLQKSPAFSFTVRD